MTKYTWKESGPAPRIEAQVFGEVVEGLTEEDGGVKAQAVVEAARARRSPIHALFEWDDSKAAEQHRLAQARGYLGALQIVRVHVRENRAVSNRAFFSVRTTESRKYVAHDRILGDADLKRQVLQDACNDLQIYVRKFALVMGLGTYVPRLEQVLAEMVEESNRLTEEALQARPPRRRAPKAAAVNDNKPAIGVG